MLPVLLNIYQTGTSSLIKYIAIANAKSHHCLPRWALNLLMRKGAGEIDLSAADTIWVLRREECSGFISH